MIDVFPVTLPRLTGRQQRRAYVYVPDAALNFFFINSSFCAAFFVIIIVLIFTCDYSADTGVEHTTNILLFL